LEREHARQVQRLPRNREKAEAIRAPGRKTIASLRKRLGIEREACARAEDRLAALCSESRREDIARSLMGRD
jgi:hypothetical protein